MFQVGTRHEVEGLLVVLLTFIDSFQVHSPKRLLYLTEYPELHQVQSKVITSSIW